MKTFEIEILNKNALEILESLEKLNIIKLLKHKKNISKEREEEIDDFFGILTPLEANELEKHIQTVRSEWERNI
jgi:predicted HAD superfamily phosphohydrolase